ncbi:MAG: ATP synthase F0 subcomplex subunit OSCP atp5 [Candelina submexicana]|nr:MAG: ATP synthase F0 subcomplex subunit OSCP atp5 [Candelina submexicana]
MSSTRAAFQVVRAAAPRASFSPRIASTVSARNYAQAAPAPSQPQDVKPPIAVYGIDGTYATALYTAAAKTSALDSTSRALSALADVFKKDPKLPSILHAPTLTVSDKSKIVQELHKHIGGTDKGDTVKNFLDTLAENNRLGILEGVCEKFGVLIGASRGEVDLTITSASPLDNKYVKQLEGTISKSAYVGPGKKLKVKNKVNPDIMGGLVVEIGDQTIDKSVSSKVAKMNKMLTDTL